MKRGFMYLTAIIDVYSRYIVGWQLSNTLEKETQTLVMNDAIKKTRKTRDCQLRPRKAIHFESLDRMCGKSPYKDQHGRQRQSYR